MSLFTAWCTGTKDKSKKKTFRTYSEKMAAVQPFSRNWARPSGPTTTRMTGSRRILGCGAFFGMLVAD